MKYCKGKFHGPVQKQIEDSEKYCLICSGRYKAEKDERNQKIKKTLATVVTVAAPLILHAALGGSDKKDS